MENRSASVFRAPANNFSVPDAGYPLGKRVCVKEKTCAAASYEESVPASVGFSIFSTCESAFMAA